ncbi:hypothetical protein Ga0609869_001398 [Rhodovulum iodosum]|uniref:NAD-dependent epimerase/dehydratase domain-containing protein n=1 Tax=Rhodovulum iodosum TaxID=68291 RepID=A0ABV3XRT3_9RHOB|nr:NAD-dependent epimerase/dehydratase family protein [Rhodovulum robiginosum]RSK30388.1 NAD-dependent epimerase/dehydratase family protein [Rhodovulum robiginosum]
MPQSSPALLIMGATGRLGRCLQAAWAGRQPGGMVPLWQTRGAVPGPDWLGWAPLTAPVPALPPLGAVLVLAGATPSGGGAPDAAPALALAGLRAARAGGAAHVFLASSQAVYGAAPGPIAESAPLAPLNAYARGKAEMEAEAARWAAAERPGAPGVTCLRIGNVAGADMLGKAVAEGGALTLDRFADGRGPERSYIGAAAFARVLDSLLTRVASGAALPFALNVAAPGAVAMADLLAAWGRDWAWRPAPDGARQSVTLDVRRLAGLHAFAPADGDPALMAAEWTRLCTP